LNEIDFIPNEYKLFFDKFFKFKFEQKCLNLFSNYENIYLCHNSLKEIMREQLSEILIKSCGHVTSRPNKSTLIICNKNNIDLNYLLKNEFECLIGKNVPVVTYEWILGKQKLFII
jgi:hypothetical protein